MNVYNTSSIRNLLLAGHAGSGKTSLAETMLFEYGSIRRRGSIESANTVSDFHEIEKEKGKSVWTSLLHLDWRGTKINLLDTPGTPDFRGEVSGAMRVADAALFLLNAEHGVEVSTESLWKEAEELGLPSVLAVNKLDEDQSDFQSAYEMARERFGRGVVIVQFPFSEGGEFHAIIDVLKMTMYEFPEGGGRPDKLPIPESRKAQAELLQNELVESIAENDESLMDLYFEHGKLDEYQMREGLQSAVANRQVFPLFCCSARANMGSGRIMGFVSNILPAPDAARPLRDENGADVPVSADGGPRLFCFKTWTESHVGTLNYVKVVGGSVRQGIDLENRRDGNSQRLGSLSAIRGDDRVDVPEALAGDLVAAVKLRDVRADDTLTAKGDDLKIAPTRYPEPVIRKALRLAGNGQEDKLGSALNQLQREDPSLLVEQSRELRQTILHGQGEEHLSVVLAQLGSRFGLQVEYEKPGIPYRETITRPVKAHYRHKKQSGGAGQYGEVHMLLEPWSEGMGETEDLSVRDVQEIDLEWGGKLVFRNCIVGGVIDNRFMPAILKGVMEKMESGPMSRCRARDIRVSVFDGSMHSVDSNEAAFKTAALMAFRDGFMKASPKLLEPVFEVEILVPARYMGDVMSDLSSRRGQILGMDSEGSIQKIRAQVPLDELDQYATALKSMTQGSATYSRNFSQYAPVPPDLQQKVVREHESQE